MSFYISIDPGSEKCGLLLADLQTRKVIEAGIASVNNFSDLVSLWNQDHQISKIIIGNGTNFKYVENELKRRELFNLDFINEQGSTLRARFRYWEIWPPNCFIRWLPKEILFPPDNLDAIAALILLEDFLQYRFIWPEEVEIKTWL